MSGVASQCWSVKGWLDERWNRVLCEQRDGSDRRLVRKRLGKRSARRRKRVRVEARGWIEVGAVVSCSILAWKRRSAELDLGSRKPLEHVHRSTANGADPESKSTDRAGS
jgi:hypothetical protein